jgi:hypothetical protein
MKLRAARSNGPGIRYLRYQANFFEPDQLSINHQFPRDGCKTNASAAESTAKPLKPLHRERRVIPSAGGN